MRKNNNSGRYTVAFHNVWREYGGPEEGGWYYDAGSPADIYHGFTRTFKSYKAAVRYCNRLINEMESGSAAHIMGRHFVVMIQRNAATPHDWPGLRPHYE